MKASYKDPYEKLPIVVEIDDDDAEGLETVLEFLNRNAREIQNAERRERYHTPYHLEALVYEGKEYASDMDVEEQIIRQETERGADDFFRSVLTEVQYRRLMLLKDGMSIREIARQEEANYKSVRESLESAVKKIKKVFENTPSKAPLKSPYSEENTPQKGDKNYEKHNGLYR